MDRNGDWDGVTVSGFVAPAMAGRLMGLDVSQLGQALALSGARAITPLAVRHGDISGAKNVANALVAQNGMQATILAKHGMTGPLDLFENRHGLKSVFPGINWMEAITAPLPADSYIMGCHVKAYPVPGDRPGHRRGRARPARQVGGDVGPAQARSRSRSPTRRRCSARRTTPAASIRSRARPPTTASTSSPRSSMHRRRLRPRTVRQRPLERPQGARRDGAAQHRLRRQPQRRARPAPSRARSAPPAPTAAPTSPRCSIRPASRARASTRRRCSTKFNSITSDQLGPSLAPAHRRCRHGARHEPVVRATDRGAGEGVEGVM